MLQVRIRKKKKKKSAVCSYWGDNYTAQFKSSAEITTVKTPRIEEHLHLPYERKQSQSETLENHESAEATLLRLANSRAKVTTQILSTFGFSQAEMPHFRACAVIMKV